MFFLAELKKKQRFHVNLLPCALGWIYRLGTDKSGDILKIFPSSFGFLGSSTLKIICFTCNSEHELPVFIVKATEVRSNANRHSKALYWDDK